jgi:hypothetical protein
MLLPAPALAQDHLDPEETLWNSYHPEWDMEIRRAFFGDGYNDNYNVRMIRGLREGVLVPTERAVSLRPILQPEPNITQERRKMRYPPKERPLFVVELVTFAEMFWGTQKADEAQVNRYQAPLDEQTALLVEKAWLAVLKRPQQEEYPRLVEDGSEFHFAARERGIGTRSGRISSPEPNTLTHYLVKLGKALEEYACRPAEEREARCKTIRAITAEILRRSTSKPAVARSLTRTK